MKCALRATVCVAALALGCSRVGPPVECPPSLPVQPAGSRVDEGAFEITVPSNLERRHLRGGAQSAGWYAPEGEVGSMGVTYRYGFFADPASVIDRAQPTSTRQCRQPAGPRTPLISMYQLADGFMLGATWNELYDGGAASASLFVMVGVSDPDELPSALAVIESVQFPDAVPPPVIEARGSPVEVQFPVSPRGGT